MRKLCIAGVSLMGLTTLATIAVWSTHQSDAKAHCQMPCGIYDDPARISGLKEDAATIAKAVKNINDLAGDRSPKGVNQSTRWVITKENHASKIIEVVSEYFLCQRVKPVTSGSGDYDTYLKKLADHHAVMVAAMKTKQTADPATVSVLSRAIERLASYY